jgi:flavin reductase (DIM6/NTAB) family NADH-FMN oxidoreductase RutF
MMNARMADTSERSFRRALGSFATGVTIVSGFAPDDAVAMGATVNSFTSVSLDPRLVLFSLRRQSVCLRCFAIGRPFAISVLSARQAGLANHFATPKANKWVDVPHRARNNSCPAVVGATAIFEGQVDSQYEAGDHVVIFGRVEHFDIDPDEHPLVFLRGDYASVRLDSNSELGSISQ